MARAGKFRDRVKFEREGRVEVAGDDENLDENGNPAEAVWADLVWISGDFRETPGRERIGAGRLEAPKTGTLRVRSASVAHYNITLADRAQIRGQTWAIIGDWTWANDRGDVWEITLQAGAAVN